MVCPFVHAIQQNTIKTSETMLLYYSPPIQIQSDNGSHVIGKPVKAFAASYNIEWVYHVPYYPGAAGLIERMNDMLKQQLKELSNGSLTDWKQHLIEELKNLNN